MFGTDSLLGFPVITVMSRTRACAHTQGMLSAFKATAHMELGDRLGRGWHQDPAQSVWYQTARRPPPGCFLTKGSKWLS